MRSKTKLAIAPETIRNLFDKAGIHGAENIAPLGAGEYNSVYAVDAAGKAYAIKIAPHPSATILTYEQEMMSQEIYYYERMANQARINVPQIFYVDFSKQDIPAEYFIMQRLPGTQIDQAILDDSQKAQADQKLAAMVAQMHTVKGDKFGYRQNQLFDNWYLALESMVTNLIADCRRMHHGTRRGQKLLATIHKNRAVLEKVECSLINFDIWPPNIFCDNQNGDLNLSWIDPERCLWGDRIADFVCLDFMNMSLDEKDATIQAYNQVSAEPVTVGAEEKIRFAIMLGYLGLIIEVEKYARYTFLHYGYWRNLMAAIMLLSNCFKQLEALTAKN